MFVTTPAPQTCSHVQLVLFPLPTQTSPVHEAPPSCTLNHLRHRATNARNKLDHHRTLLDRYLPEPMGDAQDVQSAVLYKYGELVDRMPSLEPYRPSRSASSGAASPTETTRRDFSKYNNGDATLLQMERLYDGLWCSTWCPPPERLVHQNLKTTQRRYSIPTS
ncbi:hypothetical protein NP493_250g04030 [Ridgeia piscesae]|uniref:Uncharacterized protein n=1 Tax=Ridgeia piscesae TaxID=27915 RepID=A0AAD9NYH6_RIDPI|nr:hypothetical protein NP493_250g04030 [Ridgeia piscesae]